MSQYLMTLMNIKGVDILNRHEAKNIHIVHS